MTIEEEIIADKLLRQNEANPGVAGNPYPNSKDPTNTKIEPTADGLKM